MKIPLCAFFAFLVINIVSAQEAMTPERFKQLIAAPGDTNALRPELASLPFWKTSKCSMTMKWQNGKIFKEDCLQTAKTVEGKFIVFGLDSKFYNQTNYAIAEYDGRASAIRLWGLYGDTLIFSTMVFDRERKISAATSSYADFMEISVGSSSTNEMSDHTLVYKDGVLFMTRDFTSRAIASTDTASGKP